MRARALRLALVALSLAPLAGCGATLKRIYHASVYETARVPSAGMLPTIKVGDYISIDKNYYRQHPVQRFDLVTFTLPPENIPPNISGVDTKTVYVKRVMGLGGETLEIRGGRVYVDGRQLEEPFATVPLDPRSRFGPVKIPEGELFLMGDNRPDSLDGRFWARPTLPVQNVLGKVVGIFQG